MESQLDIQAEDDSHQIDSSSAVKGDERSRIAMENRLQSKQLIDNFQKAKNPADHAAILKEIDQWLRKKDY